MHEAVPAADGEREDRESVHAGVPRGGVWLVDKGVGGGLEDTDASMPMDV